LKIAQLVLLDKRQHHLRYSDQDRQELQVLLSQLTDPVQQGTASLNLIDQHLRRKNGEALMRDVLQICAPFVIQSFGQRLKEETDALLKDIDYDNNQGKFLLFYFLNK